MKTALAILALALGATQLAAAEVVVTYGDGELRFSGDAVGHCMSFEQDGLLYVSVEAGSEDGPGLYIDFSGDSVDTAMIELRDAPGWPYWMGSNSPLYNNFAGGVQVESYVRLVDADGIVFEARLIFAGGDAYAEMDAVIAVTCD